jgi:hypothetical protein
MKFFIFYIVLLFSITNSHAGLVRELGMGHSATAAPDANSLGENISFAAFSDVLSIEINVINDFLIKELSKVCLSAYLSNRNNASIGIKIEHGGSNYFSQDDYTISVSRKLLNTFSVGGGIRFHQWNFSEPYSDFKQWAPVAGIYAIPFPNFRVGAMVINPMGSNRDIQSPSIPSTISCGIAWKLHSILFSCSSALKENNYTGINTGLEYKFNSLLLIRCGLNLKYFHQSLGFGLRLNHYTIDIYSVFNNPVGTSSGEAVSFIM